MWGLIIRMKSKLHEVDFTFVSYCLKNWGKKKGMIGIIWSRSEAIVKKRKGNRKDKFEDIGIRRSLYSAVFSLFYFAILRSFKIFFNQIRSEGASFKNVTFTNSRDVGSTCYHFQRSEFQWKWHKEEYILEYEK